MVIIFTKALYIIAGFIAVAVGFVGIVLPGIPTTPFMLLALFCFGKGSQKLRDWFVQTKLYKKHLSKYIQKKTMTLKQKITIQIIAGIVMLISFLLIQNWIIRYILIAACVIHNYVFIFFIKTEK